MTEEHHRSPSARPHHTPSHPASPDPLHENDPHKGVGYAPPPVGYRDGANVVKTNAPPPPPPKRFSTGNAVTLKATLDAYFILRSELNSENAWEYRLKDPSGVEYAHSVTEDELKRRKV